MHAKPGLRVFLKWMIAGSGSVITDVIPPKPTVTTRTQPNDSTLFNSLAFGLHSTRSLDLFVLLMAAPQARAPSGCNAISRVVGGRR